MLCTEQEKFTFQITGFYRVIDKLCLSMLHTSIYTTVHTVTLSDSVCKVCTPAWLSGCSDPQSSRKSHCRAGERTQTHDSVFKCKCYVSLFVLLSDALRKVLAKDNFFASTHAGLNAFAQCDNCRKFDWFGTNYGTRGVITSQRGW